MPAGIQYPSSLPTRGTRKKVTIQEAKQTHTKESVSAASIFKPLPRKVTRRAAHTKSTVIRSGKGISSPSISNIQEVRPPFSKRSQWKTPIRKPERSAENHPFAIAFRETTNAYRNQLYKNAVEKIYASYNSLRKRLYDANLDPVSSPDAASGSIPLAKRIKLETLDMSVPLAEMILRFNKPLANGKEQHFEMKLGERMALFKERIQSQHEEVSTLQKQWEEVVSEICECGGQILGQDSMDDLLHSEESAEASLDGSRLFVLEDGDGEAPQKSEVLAKKNKRPKFLVQASPMQGKYPHVLSLPVDQVREMDKRINNLGAVHMEELKKSHKDLEKAYTKKVQQIQAICDTDD